MEYFVGGGAIKHSRESKNIESGKVIELMV